MTIASSRTWPRTWTAIAILHACRAWALKNGHPPTAQAWTKATPEYPSKQTVIETFGSWGAMIAAGRRFMLDQWWVAAAPGVDQWENTYAGPGIAISAPGAGGSKNIIQVRPDKSAVLIYAAA